MILLTLTLWGQTDSTTFDRDILGRPFDLDEIFGAIEDALPDQQPTSLPWYDPQYLAPDSIYYGIGRSAISQDAADDDARLRFAQHVAVKVQSIAQQQVRENRDRLDADYSYESLVATDMTLRSVQIADRHRNADSTYLSLIAYGKRAYHDLLTAEIQVALEATIQQQALAHQAAEALRADSLRHKMTMDSLALSRKQAQVDSLEAILRMEEAKIRQAQERVELMKQEHADFLEIVPFHRLVDLPTATTAPSWIRAGGRWEPESWHWRHVDLGSSISIFSAEATVHAKTSIVEALSYTLKLEVLPTWGQVYPLQVALGYTGHQVLEDDEPYLDLRDEDTWFGFDQTEVNQWRHGAQRKESFMATATVGIPQLNHFFTAYLDNHRVGLGTIWYPFPTNLGSAISVVHQVDWLRQPSLRNRFDDPLEYQFGLRIISPQERLTTMISYEDHETWYLGFEFQY